MVSRALVMVATTAAALGAAGSASAVGPWPGLAPSVPSPVRRRPVHGDPRRRHDDGDGDRRDGRLHRLDADRRGIRHPGGDERRRRRRTVARRPAARARPAAAATTACGRRAASSSSPPARLARVATIALPGEFGFDAISPDRRTLYVIQHVVASDLVRYVVRAYDLRRRRLAAAGDRRQAGRRTRPCAATRSRARPRRAATWVYTLYTKEPGLVAHVRARAERGRALGVLRRPAGLDRAARTSGNAQLELAGKTLSVVTALGQGVRRGSTRGRCG